MFLGSVVEILFLHPVALSVQLIVADVKELETCNVIHNTRFLIKHLFLKCCYTSALQDSVTFPFVLFLLVNLSFSTQHSFSFI